MFIKPIFADGSSRRFYRISFQSRTFLLIHNPCDSKDINENDSYWYIGRHLYKKGIPVPRLYLYERKKGIIWLEDLGEIHLQDVADFKQNLDSTVRYYEKVLEILLKLSIEGKKGFNPKYCYDTVCYDFEFIVKRELFYFYKEFFLSYKKEDPSSEIEKEFFKLAQIVSQIPNDFLMHRDFQSRNIMIKESKPYIIDFQGARFGPPTYDLASLLIDPYVGIPDKCQIKLLKDFFLDIKRYLPYCWNEFLELFWHTALCRNLQILGAFSYLSLKKKKYYFKRFIQPALNQLEKILTIYLKERFPALKSALFY